MLIEIEDFSGRTEAVELKDVETCDKINDIIVFNGKPYKLSTAQAVEPFSLDGWWDE